ncbi:MAG: tRNA preQ1(34) S-adenosylmethionine ribosyltransferase-isomerase QueA [Clostridiales bacterium]|nr:tRNA preQ1(34) S-adenosylmethionine ribosyltransferase-isomerase QueA [Clostridiales bacterium]
MKKSDFHFELPKELIAQTPTPERDASRLLVLDKARNETYHTTFSNIVEYIKPGDCLIINDTKVIPARLLGKSAKTGANVEIFLLKQLKDDIWETLVKPGKRLKQGDSAVFGDILTARAESVTEDGKRVVRFFYQGIFEAILDKLGEMPLPPYIKRKLEDKSRYQTVYAKNAGSVAAPTAGFHFTRKILDDIRQKGANIAEITLHVGLGTFRPVKTENIFDHHMHEEWYEISRLNADIINGRSGRAIAVGTTSCRAIESAADELGRVRPGVGTTDIFIYPGYEFKITDGLTTNFHLPESTLIMLVSAFAGRENALSAYEDAIKRRYRFFSFGDAMLIL